MKVLILNDKFPPEARGGADIMAWRFGQKSVKGGHQVVVFTTVEEKEKEGVFEEDSLKVYRLFFRFPPRLMAYITIYNPKVVQKLKEIIKKEKPDLLWAHNVHCALSYTSFKKTKKMGVPVVLSLHDSISFCYRPYDCWLGPKDQEVARNYTERYKHNPWKCLKCQRFRYFPLRNFLIRYFLRYVDKVIAVSAEHQKLLLANKVKCDDYIYNGIDSFPPVSQEEIKEFKKKYNLEGKKVIFWGGRINRAGGVDQTVKALQEVVKVIPNVVFLVAAKINPSSQAFLQFAKRLGLTGKVIVTGWLERKDIALAYQVCDLAICASIAFETFGLIPLEAMANKKPAMATRFGGPREVIDDGVTGYLFNPYNIEDFAQKIIKILSNSELAKKMGEAGYQKYQRNFTLDKVFNDYLNIFNQLLKNK